MKVALVYTDGSGVWPPGPGGLAYVAIIGETRVERSARVEQATSQQAELRAAEMALRELPVCDEVELRSDSQYLVKGMTEWVEGWIRHDWTKSDGRSVANREDWERLLEAARRHGVVAFGWVRGHAGQAENERCDELAEAARLAVPPTEGSPLTRGYRRVSNQFLAMAAEDRVWPRCKARRRDGSHCGTAVVREPTGGLSDYCQYHRKVEAAR